MKLKTLPLALMIAALAAPLQAQHAGFGVAVRQPPPVMPAGQRIVNSPVQPIVRAQGTVTSPFGYGVMPPIVPPIISTGYPSAHFPTSPVTGVAPIYAPQAPIYLGPYAVSPAYNYGFNNNYGYGNNGYGYNGYGYNYGYGGYGNGMTIVAPNGTLITNSTVIIQPPQLQGARVAPGFTAPRHAIQLPQIGIPRTHLIQQFGSPVSTVFMQNGETLYFSNGVTVTIQDGKVAAAQRSN